jgi:hypothetical protein
MPDGVATIQWSEEVFFPHEKEVTGKRFENSSSGRNG